MLLWRNSKKLELSEEWKHKGREYNFIAVNLKGSILLVLSVDPVADEGHGVDADLRHLCRVVQVHGAPHEVGGFILGHRPAQDLDVLL